MKNLCIDIDNCVASTDATMRKIIGEVTKGRVNFAYEDIREFDYHGSSCIDASGQTIDKATWTIVHEQFSEPEIISTLEPISGVVENIQKLQRQYDVHFVTTRQHKARAATILWLDKVGFASYSIHFVPHRKKHEIISNMTAAIDDDAVQAELFSQVGVRSILLEHPWNTKASKFIERAAGWSDVARLLM